VSRRHGAVALVARTFKPVRGNSQIRPDVLGLVRRVLALGELQAHDTPWSSQETSALGVLRTGAKKIAMKVIRFRWGKIKRAHEGGAMEYEDDAQKLA
jgi:hypothetical protein